MPRLLDDPRVAAATLTGSTPAGKRIKKTVLDLGGSDPFIVMPSADLDAAVQTAVTARTINNGQSCIADAFERRFVRGMEMLIVGDPLDATTDVGLLATETILAGLDHYERKPNRPGSNQR